MLGIGEQHEDLALKLEEELEEDFSFTCPTLFIVVLFVAS